MPKLTIDRFAPFSQKQLQIRKSVKAPAVRRISRAALTRLAVGLAPKFSPASNPSMELTARHPHDPAGFMDSYRPGRWDCESNLVFMNGIVTGPTVGEWEGTVVYPRFKAPSAGTYLVVGNFSGYQITMSMSGPWGTTTAYCPTTSDSAAVTALWTATAGQSIFFSLNCTGLIGYLESLQVFLLS